MKIDLHVHSGASHDSKATVEELIRAAKAHGLSGIAVCDHNVFYDGPVPEDFIVLRGCEFSTPYGHLLGIGMKEAVAARDFAELVQNIHAAGGIAILAHPFEHLKYAEKLEQIAHLLDGVEVFNARATRKNRQANEQAFAFARRHRLPIFAGSDAHTPAEVGRGYIEIASLERLKDGGIAAFGRPSAAVTTAKSQWIALKKKKAPIWKYLRWSAFAAKCLAEDILRKQERKDVDYCKDW